MGIRDELVDLQKQFIIDHESEEPTKIHISRADEQRLQAMTRDEAGGNNSGSVRDRYPTLFGMQVFWDADHTHCEL